MAAKKTRVVAKPARKTTKATDGFVALTDQVAALASMSVGELQQKWRDTFGEEPRSRNKDFLRKKCSFRIQELAEGGLTQRAKKKAAELAEGASVRQSPPRRKKAAPAEATTTETPAADPNRDPRLPPVGTVLKPKYKGQVFEITVHESDFEWNGQRFKSLSGVGRAATGQSINGFLWCGLIPRPAKGGDA